MPDCMSAIGTKRTYRVAPHMSAFDPKRTLESELPERTRVMNDREVAMSEIGLDMQPTKLRRSEPRAIIL